MRTTSATPNTAALVTSINGYQSAYSRVMSGGQMSTAQTHVASQERAGTVIDAGMKGTEVDAVFNQVRIELNNERGGIVENNAEARQIVAAPWGQLDRVMQETSKSGSGGDSGKGSSKADSGQKQADYEWKNGKLVPLKPKGK